MRPCAHPRIKGRKVPVSGAGLESASSGVRLPHLRRGQVCRTVSNRGAAGGHPGILPNMGNRIDGARTRGQRLLTKFWDHALLLVDRPLVDVARRPALTFSSRPYCGPRVVDPPPAPSEQMQFILFAGKGGVGKTTLSCVSAIRIAQDFPEKRVLLFSADPAHSLSACLQTRIGPQPTLLLPGLSAMEIDAKAEFEKLKARYAEDLKHFSRVRFARLRPDLRSRGAGTHVGSCATRSGRGDGAHSHPRVSG